MDSNLKAGIEKAFLAKTGMRGSAIEDDGGCWFVEVEIEIADAGPGADYHRTFTVEPLKGVDFEFVEI
jgi:hypothetical protein